MTHEPGAVPRRPTAGEVGVGEAGVVVHEIGTRGERGVGDLAAIRVDRDRDIDELAQASRTTGTTRSISASAVIGSPGWAVIPPTSSRSAPAATNRHAPLRRQPQGRR